MAAHVLSRPSFPRTRAPLYFGGAEHPVSFAIRQKSRWIPAFAGMTSKSRRARLTPYVIPAKAGIQGFIATRR
ncbi:hypothetical protein [Lysobacter gummosus]|uniref:hypothetical protein n=1 Tax=Lysobacter gummosus TaxID=262324 RepID=UPI003624E9AE